MVIGTLLWLFHDADSLLLELFTSNLSDSSLISKFGFLGPVEFYLTHFSQLIVSLKMYTSVFFTSTDRFDNFNTH